MSDTAKIIENETAGHSSTEATQTNVNIDDINDMLQVIENESTDDSDLNANDDKSADNRAITNEQIELAHIERTDDDQENKNATNSQHDKGTVAVSNTSDTDTTDSIPNDNNTENNDNNEKPKENQQPDPYVLQTLHIDVQLKMQNKIKYHLLYSSHFYIRICILILTIILMMLSLSYAFGAISSTELKVISHCKALTLPEIWDNSAAMGSQIGDQTDKCQTTSNVKVDTDIIYNKDIYEYKSKSDPSSIFQCIVFSLFTCFCVVIFGYGVRSLITDRNAIKQQKLYTKAPKFKTYLKNTTTANAGNGIIACIKRLNFKYDKYFGVDTDGYIARMIMIEIWEIILQSWALLFYNGYNIFDPTGLYLANRMQYLIVFVTMLSFNCIVAGILWLLYVFKPNKCNGLVFKLCSFCTDQFCDLFYAFYPFIVVLSENNEFGTTTNPVFVAFGLLNNDSAMAFIFAAFPIFLLCTKCLMMTRSAIKAMRNESYDIWLLVTNKIKVMNTPNDEDAAYFANNFEHKLNISKSINDPHSVEKGKKCRISIAIIAISFIIYSIVLLSLVVTHLMASNNYCRTAVNELDIEGLINHPELLVYDKCEYPVFPFPFNDKDSNCDCRIFKINWNEVKPKFSQNFTQNIIMNGVLSQWRMLEKFRTTGDLVFNTNKDNFIGNTGNTIEFKLLSSHFGASKMKMFKWTDMNIAYIDEAISNWNELEYFELEYIDSLSTFPASFSKLTKLKAIKLAHVPLINYLDKLCNLTELQVIVIRGTMSSFIPHCFTNLNKLEQLYIHDDDLTAFTLGLLEMQNLKAIDLWKNKITYYDILEYNDINNDTDPFVYYMNKSMDIISTSIWLNANEFCIDFADNLLPEGAYKWANNGGVCSNLECTRDDPFGGSCVPSALGNGHCDSRCNKTSCHMDNGDCCQLCFTETACNYTQFLNDICDDECNNQQCYWDNQNCNTNMTTNLAPSTSSTESTAPGPKGPKGTN